MVKEFLCMDRIPRCTLLMKMTYKSIPALFELAIVAVAAKPEVLVSFAGE